MSEHPSFEGAPPGEPIKGQTFRADGWVLYELRRPMAGLDFLSMASRIGEENIVFLSCTRRGGGDDTVIVSARLLIHPDAIQYVEAAERRPS